jgi:hypothetical protein
MIPRNSRLQKNTLLQVAQATAETKTYKRVFFSPTQEKLKNKKFPSLQKYKTSQTHSPRQTDTYIHRRHLTAQYLRTLHRDTDIRTPACNTGLAKVAARCFVGQFCGYINFNASYESLVLINRHLRQARNRYKAF